MHYLDEGNIFLFLVQVTILLGLSRILGEVLRRRGQPAVVGEMFVGLLLGRTVLGRVAPEWYQTLFPADLLQWTMLNTIAWLGLVGFLLKTGLETDFSAAWRQKGDALIVSLCDLVIPAAIAFGACLLLPRSFTAGAARPLIFASFIAVMTTISALPVTARVMQALNISKTDMGFFTTCALTITDVAGWLLFAVLLGTFSATNQSLPDMALMVVATIAFVGLCLGVGRAAASLVISRLQAWQVPEPGASVTFICLLGLACGAITMSLGVHALFGFFIAGIVAGEIKAISERSREVFGQFVQGLVVPLFFARIGLKIDVLANFNPWLVLFVVCLGVIARFAGAWIGVTLSQQPRTNRLPIAIAHISGGEMQIVVAILALQCHMINETVFVAIVCGALITAVIMGPWMRMALRRRKEGLLLAFVPGRMPVVELLDDNRNNAISTLCAAAARQDETLDAEKIARAVLTREEDKGTGIEEGIAVPHARLTHLARPLIVFGRSMAGIDWNAPDGKPAQHIFLVLTPATGADVQLHILRAICLAMRHATLRAAILAAHDADHVTELLLKSMSDDRQTA